MIPSSFVGDVDFIAHLILCLLPFEFEVGLSDFGWLNEFHIVDVDGFSDEVGLLKTSLVVVVDETID